MAKRNPGLLPGFLVNSYSCVWNNIFHLQSIISFLGHHICWYWDGCGDLRLRMLYVDQRSEDAGSTKQPAELPGASAPELMQSLSYPNIT
ncbi:hypothetical protein [Chitinophaga sp. CF418]|uniref:hypothetical protein n=1 Tax=Chitinophaga sp. CF418 TaxID=1855287 RepID=UPI00122CE941|nr:hypothetical protein [Chitinophaga sp. CF418]